MKPINFKRIEIRKPRWNNNPNEETKNTEYHKCLFIVFEDYDGVEYDYMPRWDELKSLQESKNYIEDLNKKLAKEVLNNGNN